MLQQLPVQLIVSSICNAADAGSTWQQENWHRIQSTLKSNMTGVLLALRVYRRYRLPFAVMYPNQTLIASFQASNWLAAAEQLMPANHILAGLTCTRLSVPGPNPVQHALMAPTQQPCSAITCRVSGLRVIILCRLNLPSA